MGAVSRVIGSTASRHSAGFRDGRLAHRKNSRAGRPGEPLLRRRGREDALHHRAQESVFDSGIGDGAPAFNALNLFHGKRPAERGGGESDSCQKRRENRGAL
jgi:hypothetical protein